MFSFKVHRPKKFFLLAIAILVSLASPAYADRKYEARQQFERAVRIRTALEERPEKARTLADYKQAVAAYQKVYLITPQAEEVTPALIAEAELYQQMARQFDEKYFQSAIDTYNFLLKQYPESRYRSEAIFSIAQIQKDDLGRPEVAEVTFKDFLKRFPKSDKAPKARQALKEISDAREVVVAKEKPPEIKGQIVEQRESTHATPHVTDIHTWNAENYTRIVVSLEDTVKFDSAHIASPDRVYFDLHKALIGPGLANKTIDVKNGLLKSVRVGQNREGVVRLVLDVDGARDCSAYLVSNPYRLVIEVRNNAATSTAKNGSSTPAQPAATTPATAAPAKDDAEKTSANAAEKTNESVSAANEKDPASAKLTAKLVATPASKSTPSKTKSSAANSAPLQPPTEPKPTRDGQHSLTRALGLKIGRIVIDPGHGGHDTGTIGPHGLMEKDLCLDVALRLGHLIEQKLPGAEVVYTRKDDTFIPLEQRTAIANDAKADLFISIHANSSHDHEARGIETYYLNFATSEESLEVATRENSLSQEGLHDLQDIVKKIARNEKIEESKEFANDVQDSLAHRMQLVSQNEKNRGVKKAPFVVLIGANMPSILSEISFISNPSDEKLLRKPDQRQRVADGLYRGIAAYLDNLNSLSYGKTKLVSDNRPAALPVKATRPIAERSADQSPNSGGAIATVASNGNPK
ncbi:MAG: N-acetylmuramoyl-L-alanine amidase [Candidatus Acidiferrales bacterium]